MMQMCDMVMVARRLRSSVFCGTLELLTLKTFHMHKNIYNSEARK